MAPIDKGDLEGPKIDRRTTMKLLSSVGLAGLAGCTGGGGEGGTPTTPDTPTGTATKVEGGQEEGTPTPSPTPAVGKEQLGGKISVGMPVGKIVELDPHMVELSGEMHIMVNLFNGLTKLNNNLELVGDLAKDWSLPDKTTYVFTLHDGVKFHNGNKLDAQAVKWSIKRVMENKASPHHGKAAFIKSVEAPDDTTVRINLEKPQAPFIVFTSRGSGRLGTVVPPSEAPSEMSAKTSEFSKNPVGSGPFKYTGREQGKVIHTEKFDDYWETDRAGVQLPYLQKIDYRLIPERATLFTALKNNALQYAHRAGAQNVKAARKTKNLDVSIPSTGTFHVITCQSDNPLDNWDSVWSKVATNPDQPPKKWEDKDPPTANDNVARAVGLAIDRKELVRRAYFGLAEPAHTIINPAIQWAFDRKPPNALVYKPEKAKQLLDEAGFTGNPRFSASFIAPPYFERIATVVQRQLERIGIDISLTTLPSSSYWSRMYKFKDTFKMTYSSWDIDPNQSWWKQIHTPDLDLGAGVWNARVYSNSEFDEFLEKSFVTPNRDKRVKYVKEAEKIALKDAPMVPLAYPSGKKVFQSNLEQAYDPLGFTKFTRAFLKD